MARELAGGARSGLTDADLLAEAVVIEGHPDNVAAADGNRAAPPMLVTADMLHAKIGEAERNPELDAKGRASLIALYRDALSNLGKIDTHTARAVRSAKKPRRA